MERPFIMKGKTMERIIVNKYKANCKKCGKNIEIGSKCQYVKWAGVFCVDHELTTEDIREARQERADKKAERLTQKAERLEKQADIKQSGFDKFRGDTAFLTQPGHIPFRERLIDRYDKGSELRNEAEKSRERANSISNSVRVKGDAEKKHQAKRDYITANIKVGDKIYWMVNIEVEVIKINPKTVKVKGQFGNFNVDKCLCDLMKGVNNEQ